ncbi:MAG: hypothetical protein M1269_04600 [Chloroflexi bacterium]|nr:hypothetical protein [Chloroflexota bacterium]
MEKRLSKKVSPKFQSIPRSYATTIPLLRGVPQAGWVNWRLGGSGNPTPTRKSDFSDNLGEGYCEQELRLMEKLLENSILWII